MKQNNLKNVILSAMFLGIGIALPFLFGQVPQIGSMLLPMHIPVFLCAFVCGPYYGMGVAVILPLLRSLLFSRPNLYPEAIAIAAEMAAYALIAGLLYRHLNRSGIRAVYLSLFPAMLGGRAVRAAVQFALLGFRGTAFSWPAFLSGVIVAGIPGIVLQLVILPLLMLTFHRTGLVPFEKSK